MADKSKIKYLLNLIDDRNNDIYQKVKIEIEKYGKEIIPELEIFWANSKNKLVQHRIEDIIKQINFIDIKNEFNKWLKNDRYDLLKATYIISKIRNPDLDINNIKKSISKIKDNIWLEFNDNLTGLEKVTILNKIFFGLHNFKTITQLKNINLSFLDNLLKTKKGDFFSISLLYLIIAQSLDMPIYGVNLPNTFILAYKDLYSDPFNNIISKNNVLFYINPFLKGRPFNREQIETYIKQQKLKYKESYFETTDNIIVIKNYIEYLILFYKRIKINDYILQLEYMLKKIKKSING